LGQPRGGGEVGADGKKHENRSGDKLRTGNRPLTGHQYTSQARGRSNENETSLSFERWSRKGGEKGKARA